MHSDRRSLQQLSACLDALLMLFFLSLFACRRSWVAMWEERKKFVRAVMRLKNRPLSMAYNSWVEMREQGLFLRRLAMRTLNRDLNKGVRVSPPRLFCTRARVVLFLLL